ncbi:MAG: hypothetical protein R2825_08900 [Saprospiraceae bacterium]
MQGQLTATWRQQHPNVEPPPELLRRIREESKAHRLGQAEKAYAAAGEEGAFELPENWVWCRMKVVNMSRGRFSNSAKNDPRYFGGKYPLSKSGSLDEKVQL